MADPRLRVSVGGVVGGVVFLILIVAAIVFFSQEWSKEWRVEILVWSVGCVAWRVESG